MSEVLVATEQVELAPPIVDPSLGVSQESTQPIAEAAATPSQEEAEQVFKHTLDDGREVEGTLEQARRVCPVMAKMSIEKAREALAQADLIARVAQRGKERRANEAVKTANAGSSTKGADRAKTAVNKTEASVKPVHERPNEDQASPVSVEQSVDEEAVASPPIAEHTMPPHQQRNLDAAKVTVKREEDAHSSAAIMVTAESGMHEVHVAQEQAVAEPDRSISEQVSVQAANRELPVMRLPSVAVEHMVPPEAERPAAELHEAAEAIERPSLETIDVVEQSVAIDVAKLRAEIAGLYIEDVVEEAAPSEAEGAGNPGPGVMDAVTERFAPEPIAIEVVELQQQLTAIAETVPDAEPGAGLAFLLAAERALQEEMMMVEIASLAEPVELAPDAVISLRQGNAENASADSIESTRMILFHENMTVSQQDQPLEVTLAHVVRSLRMEVTSDHQEGSSPQAYEVVEALADLQAALAEVDIDATAAEQLTPRVIAEMLRLLGILGYEQPQEILLMFVQERGLQSLLEMMEYLCRLSHHENRKEFLRAPAVRRFTDSGTLADDGVRRRTNLARALFQLMHDLFVYPGSFAGDTHAPAA